MPIKFNKEFKQNAVRLVVEDGVSVSHAAKDLSVGVSTLQRWMCELKTHGQSAFPRKGYLRPHDERVKKLGRENEVLKREQDILKKAQRTQLMNGTV